MSSRPSFVIAFADRRGAARLVTGSAPGVILVCGAYAMLSNGTGTLTVALGSCLLLLVVAVALHAKMYALRPEPAQLTRFYLAMSLGGALGGLFTALLAPLWFDWVWEHPLLILAAACLVPLPARPVWAAEAEPGLRRIAFALLLGMALFLSWLLKDAADAAGQELQALLLTLFVTGCGLMLASWRWAYALVLVALMLAEGGHWTVEASRDRLRTRSYFGVYTVRDYGETGFFDGPTRILAHGTTLHGLQSLTPGREREVMSYYGPASGVGRALGAVPRLVGSHARVGVVGLGTGSLACLSAPGQDWTFFEIDPAVLAFSRPPQGAPRFTFLQRCQPAAQVVLGDARLELAKGPPARFDVLVIDAFSSDAIPLHLMTAEAMAVYARALAPGGLMLFHVSNRYLALEPQVDALARDGGVGVIRRFDNPADRKRYTPSVWLALSRDPALLARLARQGGDAPWEKPQTPAPRGWTDDHASILPAIRWDKLLGRP